MGGANPYIDDADFELPKAKYPIVFRISETGEELEFEVDPEALPYDHDGLPGSILDIAQGHGVDLQHTCGGVCACSTCHVKVLEGLDTCNSRARPKRISSTWRRTFTRRSRGSAASACRTARAGSWSRSPPGTATRKKKRRTDGDLPESRPDVLKIPAKPSRRAGVPHAERSLPRQKPIGIRR